MTATPPRSSRRLFTLIGEVPTQVRELVRAEFELVKAEVLAKLAVAGIGVGFLAIALVTLLLFIGVLLTAAVLALALVMPGWLAALVVAFVLLLVIVLLVLLGIRSLRESMPPVPERSVASLRRDWYTLIGVLSRTPAGAQAAPEGDVWVDPWSDKRTGGRSEPRTEQRGDRA